MRHRLFTSVALAFPVAFSACATTAPESGSRYVSVRFVAPPAPERFVAACDESEVRLASDTYHDGTPTEHVAGSDWAPPEDPRFVALWGGGYDGYDVTYSDAPLEPGHYTFGLWDQTHATGLQGWLNVNNSRADLVDVLRTWKARIPQQKQWLAYEHELQGSLQEADAEVFRSFGKQLRAFDRLERELDRAIDRESQLQVATRQHNREFLDSARILVLPGGSALFHPTTRPAYKEQEVEQVRGGDVVTKMLFLADYENTEARMRMVNSLVRNLKACKAVLIEEVDRLERRKRFMTITDHVFNHDKEFVRNEMRLQQSLSAIDQLNEQVAEMRMRRVALAFTSELLAGDEMFRPLEEEQRDLEEERLVLETRKHRLDLLYNESDEKSVRRVALERFRQRHARAIEHVDEQVALLGRARETLTAMKQTSDVIHRQGDFRLMAAGFVGEDMPFRVREAVAREALMTMRLQTTDGPLESGSHRLTSYHTTASFGPPSP